MQVSTKQQYLMLDICFQSNYIGNYNCFFRANKRMNPSMNLYKTFTMRKVPLQPFYSMHTIIYSYTSKLLLFVNFLFIWVIFDQKAHKTLLNCPYFIPKNSIELRKTQRIQVEMNERLAEKPRRTLQNLNVDNLPEFDQK